MVATTLPAVAKAADCRVLIWNVRSLCETSDLFWICLGMVITILTVLSDGLFANPILDDCSRQNETDENAACRGPMKNDFEHREKVFQISIAWNLVASDAAYCHEICKNRLDDSAVHPVCVKARLSIVKRQPEL